MQLSKPVAAEPSLCTHGVCSPQQLLKGGEVVILHRQHPLKDVPGSGPVACGWQGRRGEWETVGQAGSGMLGDAGHLVSKSAVRKGAVSSSHSRNAGTPAKRGWPLRSQPAN